ncbi:MAG: hypothetical protein PVF57_12660 [Pseudomonadales bacterium]|jgi:hypothetical protein
MAEQPRWVDPHEGFEYEPESVTVGREKQAGKLTLCGIDPDLYGNTVDASFFIGLAIRAGVVSGISAEGNVNMLQSLVQHRPALLDEPLLVRGRITAVTPVPRGRTIDTDVWFEDEAGERVITARRRSLKPDPEASGRGAGERPPPVLAAPDTAEVCSTHGLTPEIVVAYSEPGNSIHYDPEAARRAGFRAPLIGGGMGVHYLMAALYAAGPLQRFDLDIYFRRPIFWDDTFDVVREESAIGLLRRDGGLTKVLTEARINSMQ